LVICELYWVYINYRHARSNFFDTSSLALQKSVDRYYLGLNQLPISLKDVRKPTLTYLLTDFLDSTAKREKKTKLAKKTRLSFQSVSIEKPNLQDFKGLMARLISQSKNQQLNLDTLDLIFHHELARRGISERFTLSLQKMNNHLDSWEISTIIHFSNGAKRITGTLEDRSAYFLRTNLGPGLVSIALIMMSLGSLFYMNYILRRHIQLDIMKTSFTNNIIHELRTPLSILRSTNEALADFGAAKDEQSLMRYLGINKVVIEDLNNNIERILESVDPNRESAHHNWIP
jgi:two-component system phosphate regulon sensor histidine kinase PhoR